MSYISRKLISKAYYLSEIVSREFQSVSGAQYSDGLDSLNEILTFKLIDKNVIPYYQEYSLNAVIGQEKYFIPNLVDIETITFNIGSVRYKMLAVDRGRYFGGSRVDDIKTLPLSWHFERKKGGSSIYIYFIPDQNYPIKIWGKFSFDEVLIDTDLSAIYDLGYIRYLKYELAEEICDENNIVFGSAAHLDKIRNKINQLSPRSVVLEKKSALRKRASMNYGDINLGRGWRP